jgi:2-polyprenyl-3-methyl-5-hydroxy-6-metoxy-1,4-benzoquinol methylase
MQTTTSEPFDQQVEEGQAIYTKKALTIYDFVVLVVSNPLIWKYPTRDMREYFDELTTPNHLDVAVGTGYFLDRLTQLKQFENLDLFDLNEECLASTKKRIARFNPKTIQGDVFKKEDTGKLGKYSSISVQYLLHCVPGSMEKKSDIFKNLATHLEDDGILFGATILSDQKKSFVAKKLMALYNKKGVFHNEEDSLVGLESALSAHLKIQTLEVKGCVASFVCKKLVCS